MLWRYRGIDTEVRNMVKRCKECQVNKKISEPIIPLTIISTAGEPIEKIYLDLVGFLVKVEGCECILTTQCDHTKFITATPITDKRTETVAKAYVEKVILKYGIPKIICTDREAELMSKLFIDLCKQFNI